MKVRLNEMKQREEYRPVAPVCREHDAPLIFDPGTPDPFMLFDHRVRAEWRDRIPAVMHVDGTARLQTVDGAAEPLAQILNGYATASGIPVLCNTSANLLGSGFFPDAHSAMEWGQTMYVWSDGTLYRKSRR
jgi:carbamoyltransferase